MPVPRGRRKTASSSEGTVICASRASRQRKERSICTLRSCPSCHAWLTCGSDGHSVVGWAWGAARECRGRGASGAAVPPRTSFACLSTLPNGAAGDRFAGALQGRVSHGSVLELFSGGEDSWPRRFSWRLVSYTARFIPSRRAFCRRCRGFWTCWSLVRCRSPTCCCAQRALPPILRETAPRQQIKPGAL